MSFLKRVLYMGLGGLLVLGIVIGGAAVFAQSGDDAEDPATQDDVPEAGILPEAGVEQDEDGLEPEIRTWRFGARSALGNNGNELLAEALGISVEELQAAHEEVRLAVIDQALEEGLITEDQAEQLRESERPFRAGRAVRGLVINTEELLADALGISVEELQEARAEVRAARLEELVEAGVLTQEQADLIAAREAVAGYVDRDALAETIQNAYEAAIDAALQDGAITQEQADALLEFVPNIGAPGLPGFGFGGGRGHHHGHGFAPGDAFGPDAFAPETSGTIIESLFDA